MTAQSDGLNVRFEFCGINMLLNCTDKGVWRLRSERNSAFDDMGAAQTLARDLGEQYDKQPLPVDFSAGSGCFTARAQDGSYVEIGDKAIAFYDSASQLVREIKNIKASGSGTLVTVAAYRGEKFYGTGERFNKVNQRGKKLDIYAVDRWCQTRGNSYIPIPFLFSSRGNALLMNRYERSVFDICKSRRSEIIIEQKYAAADLYIFTGSSPADILSAYCRLTGFAPMPPEWSFGTLVCRYHPEFQTKEGVFAMADAMKENDFPWDAVILEGFRPYRTENLPELREICDKVHSMGRKVMLYEQCGRFPGNSEEYFGLDDSYAVSSDEGTLLSETNSFNLIDNFSKKKMRCVDLTSDRARKKWLEFWNIYVDGMGIEGAKIDFCEQFPDIPTLHFADGRDPMGAHHWYPTLYNALRYRHFGTRPEGGVNFSRGGGIGAQRYPFVWAGDQRREFFFLKVVIKAALSLGLSGVPFVSWDMAGYQPSFNPLDRRCEEKVFIRGLEFTAFSANIQTHGKIKRPYDFDAHTRDVYRAYAKLHECLKPYIAEQAKVCCETGLPLMRHLFLTFGDDAKTHGIEDEYMLGSALLVAPVLKRFNRRSIYLPEGEWVNIFGGKEYTGGRYIKNCRVPLEAVPVFRLKGAQSEAIEKALADAKPLIEEINALCGK